MSEFNRFDSWLKDGGPAAIVFREQLEPVEGPNCVFFPATYAAAEDKRTFAGGYNIDTHSETNNICLVDSVGSQANRIEPIFQKHAFRDLVPQVSIRAGDKSINLLMAGHRAADALIRFSKAGEAVWDAFQALLNKKNAEPMAKIAPTSLVFGVWDSRGTQVKVPRVFRSVVRAENVLKLTRSAQFNRATKYVEEGVIDEALDTGEGDKNPLSREGFKDSPATASHGGVIARGDIYREITINLVAIRRLAAGQGDDSDSEANLKLRRYILGLALIAGTANSDDLYDFREGCQLRQKPKTASQWRAVPHRGEDEPLPDLTTKVAEVYAKAAAVAFGVGPSGEFVFDKVVAEKWLALKKEEQDKRRRNGPMTQQFQDEGASNSSASSGSRKKSRNRSEVQSDGN